MKHKDLVVYSAITIALCIVCMLVVHACDSVAINKYKESYQHMVSRVNKLQRQLSTPKPTASPAPASPAPTVAPKKTSEPIDFSISKIKETIKRENYGYVSYTDLARNPNDYKGKSLTYEGKIVQTIEDYSIDGIVYYNIRLAVGGDYNSIVHITYMTGDDDPRLLEDDYVQVYGTAEGLYTYESTSGKSITLPEITATLIE